jgi:mannose-6-phosphate isomerase-like protein (cupin superfamily)
MAGRSKPPVETWTEERCWITELLNEARLDEVSVARCRVEPGVTTALHALSVREWYVIESGVGRMRLGKTGENEEYRVQAGDTVAIPAGCPQQIANIGAGDLLFLCVCVPRFTNASYTTLE